MLDIFFNATLILDLDKEEREIYENDLKALRIQKVEIKTAEEKGERKKSIEIVLEMLKDEESIENIVKYRSLVKRIY